MTVLNAQARAILWLTGLGRKFIRVSPKQTLGLLAFAFLSQVSLVIAFVLPVKIVILLSSSQAPSYFPWPLTMLSQRSLILVLSLIAVAFYAFHLVSNWLAKRFSDRGSEAIVQAAGKLTFFDEQPQKARSAYRDYCIALASLLFALAGFATLVLIYPLMANVLAFYMTAIFVWMSVLAARRKAMTNSREDWGEKLKFAGGFGFVLLFAGIVLDQMLQGQQSSQDTGVAAVYSIMTLLIARQLLNRLVDGAKKFLKLNANRALLDAIFLHRNPVDKTYIKQPDEDLQAFLTPQRRNFWITEVLSSIPQTAEACIDNTRWCDLHEKDVFVLQGITTNGASLLIKVYKKTRAIAIHEAVLLEQANLPLPAGRWIAQSERQGYRIHLLDLKGTARLQSLDQQQLSAAQLSVHAELLSVRPPQDLVDRYLRSTAMLWQRLTPERIARLYLVAQSKADLEAVRQLEDERDRLEVELRRAPLAIVNPKLNRFNLLLKDDSKPLLLDWGRWSLEPIGSGCLAHTSELIQTPGLGGPRLQQIQSDLRSQQRFCLGALAYELDQCIENWTLLEAIDLLPDLQTALDRFRRAPEQPAHTAQELDG